MRPWTRMGVAALALLGGVLGSGFAEAGEAPDAAPATEKKTAFGGAIAEVTVFTQGRARVTRRGELELPAGKTVLVSAPLPVRADPASVTVAFIPKNGKVLVEGVETRTQLVDVAALEGQRARFEQERKQQEDAVFAARQRLAELDDAKDTHEETLELVKTLRGSLAVVRADDDNGTPVVKVEDWTAAIKLAAESSAKARAELRTLTAKRRDAAEALETEQRKLREIGQRAPKSVNETRAIVTLSSDAPAQGTFVLHYNVTGATWSPSYRAGADLDAKKITVDIHGVVSQATGEDWTDVALRLSTARPDLGTDVPTLQPWYIHTAALADVRIGKQAVINNNMAMTPRQQLIMAAPTPPAGEAPGDSASGPRASSIVTVFGAEGAATIPSDKQTHRIQLASFTSDFEVVHIAIPKIQPYAFMRAITTNRTPWPLLPGVVEVNVGDAYIGRGMMRLTAPGEKVRLGIGRDENISVEIKPLVDQSERKTRGDHVQSVNAFEIAMTNGAAQPVRLTVLDQLPVSTNNDIAVTYGTEARKALRGANFPGQLQWEVELKANEKKTLEFDFTLDYPENLRAALDVSANRNLKFNWEKVSPVSPSAAPASAVQLEDSVDLNLRF